MTALCSFQKPSSKFASLNSWQAHLIKSLVIHSDDNPTTINKPSPSFDCTQARTMVEKTICKDVHISSLDATLTANYKQAQAANTGAKHQQLLDGQRAWLKQRNACKTAECLADSYTRRIEDLCSSISGACEK
jgi:uncharacterized protein